MNLCAYKDIFGKPGTGIHSYRFMNIAVFDLLGTILFAIIIHHLFVAKYGIGLEITIIALLVISVLVHRLFCVNTTMVKIVYG